MPSGASIGGAYAPDANYTRTGATDTGGTYSGATLTSPTITSPTISGNTTVAAGATLTGPTIVGPALRQNVVNQTAATLAPTSSQSNAVFLINRAAGVAVTLPAPVVGLLYDFWIQTTCTGTFSITTDAGTTFIGGTIMSGVDATTPGANPGPKLFSANGTSHVTYTADADTKGRLVNTYLRLTCVSSTVWLISGIANASGTIATPFA